MALMVGVLLSCGEEDKPVDCALSDLSVSVLAQTSENCSEAGSIELQGVGGEAPYAYSVNGISFQDESLFEGLSAGEYSVLVRDANHCMKSLGVEIGSDIPDLSVEVIIDQAAGCGGTVGQLTLVPEAPDAVYSYSLDGGAFATEEVYTDLSQGMHDLVVQDAAGCQDETTVYVPSGISYSMEVAEIISTNCTLAKCHVAGNGIPDFSEFSVIQQQAESIKKNTQNKTMPKEGVLTDEEIAKIACWVEDGALDN
ncbi:hypothetical protein [Reichenbachiella sp. 5M10]|uniref:hypothetical protein n=1 Tax=Reichenbachiella sp. 5M10 TaxID=1889772 RepID=UPI00117AF048|nr:hypothetical protein [Reichenbachiella sp. 5M10]